MADSVSMRHAQSGRIQRASRDAFDRVWSLEGWDLVDEPQPDEAAAESKPRRGRRAKAEPTEPVDEPSIEDE